MLQLMEEAAETQVMVIGPFANVARPQRCQVVEKILVLEAPTAWRNMSDFLLHPPSSGNRVNAVVVSRDAVVASGNVGGDLVTLEESKGLGQHLACSPLLNEWRPRVNLRERRRGDHDLSSRLRLLERRLGGLRRRSRS